MPHPSYSQLATSPEADEAGIEASADVDFWLAAARFSKRTGFSELIFCDAAMRRCASAFAKLDRDAAGDYFAALLTGTACEADAEPSELADAARYEAGRRRLAAFRRLRAALGFAAAGSGPDTKN